MAKVLSRVVDGIGEVHLADGRHRNALSPEMSEQLASAVRAVEAGGARAVVLTADPPVFSAGGSLRSLASGADPEPAYEGLRALDNCPVPTVGVVAGPALGAGLNLMLACDLVIVTPNARIESRFLDVGIHPGGGHLLRLLRQAGPQTAAALTLFGASLTGDEVVRAGFAWTCVSDGSEQHVAYALASAAAQRWGPLTRRTKATLRESMATVRPEDAWAKELEAQRWSMRQVGFRRGLARAQKETVRRIPEGKAAVAGTEERDE